MKPILSILLLLLLVSCSEGDSSNASIEVKSQFSASASGGGLMVWGLHEDNKTKFAIAVDRNNEVSIRLIQGRWKFYAMGWKGSQPLMGDRVCAEGEEEIHLKKKNVVKLGLDDCGNSSPTEYPNFRTHYYKIILMNWIPLKENYILKTPGITSRCFSPDIGFQPFYLAPNYSFDYFNLQTKFFSDDDCKNPLDTTTTSSDESPETSGE